MKHVSHRAAFTLVELLVVIGIIAVLLAILLPALNRARGQAQELTCMANLKQWGLAYQMYCDANRGWLPDDGEDGTGPTNAVGAWDGEPIAGTPTAGHAPLWFVALPPFLKAAPYNVLQTDPSASRTNALPRAGDGSLFVCTAATDALAALGDSAGVVSNGYYRIYGYEADGSIRQRTTYMCYVPNSKLNQTSDVLKIAQIRQASSVALMVEKRMNPKEIPAGVGPDYVTYFSKSLGRVKADWQRFAGRHRKGGYVLFADGHVAWFLNYEVANFSKANLTQNWNQPGKLIWNPFGNAN